MRAGPTPYKYSTRRSFKVGQSASGKPFDIDRVVTVDIGMTKSFCRVLKAIQVIPKQ